MQESQKSQEAEVWPHIQRLDSALEGLRLSVANLERILDRLSSAVDKLAEVQKTQAVQAVQLEHVETYLSSRVDRLETALFRLLLASVTLALTAAGSLLYMILR